MIALLQMFPSTKRTSRPRTHTVSAVRDGRMSFESDTSTLINVGLPMSKALPKYDNAVIQVEMIDEEDQAWGAPPSSGFKWNLPKFASRKSRS
ncbi:hypothetical protein D9619_002474 [Psilocybe cf. subviscida]|uniref:Uncharacterized protein n=1 Tax=Psilocybe cf. subviscida TaxID=2480587 RepID=A0A8H5AXD6_9AGAR|nr:hypothetical protein D9619_002474 [Psilocybe cf. subviscida]